MSFRSDISPGAGIRIAPQRVPVFAQSSLSPDSAHFVSTKGPPQVFPPTKREPAKADSAGRLPPEGVHADPKTTTAVGFPHPPPYQTSEFFIQDRAKPVTGQVRGITGGDNPKFVVPSFQRFGHQDETRLQREKQSSPGSGRSQPSIASTHRSPKRGRPGLVSHQVTSGQTKPSQRAEPSHKHPVPSFLGSTRPSDHFRKSDLSSPVPLGDLDHSMKGSPLLFTHQPNRRVGEQANRPVVPGPVVDPRSAAPLRPNSRESNISKRRVNSGRVSFPFHGDEMADLENFGSAWNHYLQNHARRSENAASRMAELEKMLEEKTKSIKEHTLKCNRQSEAIAGLEGRVSDLTAQKQQLTEENQAVKKKLERNEARREEMQSKMRSYRDKLNEAITEQQDLYTRSKHLCDAAIDDVRKTQEQTEATQRMATEMVAEGAQKAAEARREMKALLEGELRECQLLRNTAENENADLKKQLLDVQNELQGDKAKVEELLSQLERQGPAREHFQTLESKSDEILLQLQQTNSLLPTNEETHRTMSSKLDEVLEQVQTTALSSLEYSNLRETINGLASQLDSTSSQLLADVRSVLAGQSSTVAMSSGLEKTIKDQLSSVNNLIKEQEESLTNKLQEKEGECQELAARLAEKSSELTTATANVQQVSQMAEEKNVQVKELHSKIGELQEISQEKHQLELENKVLVERLSSKDSDNASLQLQLEDALGQNNSRALELRTLTRQIADRLQERGESASDISNLRTKMACKLELEKSKLDEAKQALQKHEEEKSRLGKELVDIASEKAKFSKDLEELRVLRADETASLERTKMSLTHAEQRIVNLKDKLKKSEFKTRDIQNALTQWAGKKNDGAELPEGFLDLNLDAMRVLVKSIMETHRESEAAKDCLRAVLEIPSTEMLDDVCRVEKLDDSPARGQESGSAEANVTTMEVPAPRTTLGTPMGSRPMSESSNGAVSPGAPAPLDTTKDSVRRIIVQSPFEEGGGYLPPSVEEERMSRRRYAQPLSILKSPSVPAIEKGSSTPVSPRGQRASTNLSALGTRSRSLSSNHRDSPVSQTDVMDNKEVDARTAGFLGRIKESLGLQRTVSTDNGRKRKGSTGEEGNPAKNAKTWQSMFGTLDLEIRDLKSPYFPAPAQPRRVTDDAAEKRGSTPTGGKGSRTNPSPRGILLGQQRQRGKGRGVIRTYSKKPQEPGMEKAH